MGEVSVKKTIHLKRKQVHPARPMDFLYSSVHNQKKSESVDNPVRSSFMSSAGGSKAHQSRFSMQLQGSIRLSQAESPKKQSAFKFTHCRNQS